MKEASFSKIIGSRGIFVDGDWVESKDQDPNGDVRLIQLADIGDGLFINKSKRYLTSEKAKELKCTFLEPGDLLIARMPDPLGRACLFPQIEMPCVTVVDVCIVRPDKNIVSSEWLKLLINSHGFRKAISKYITGTTRQRISRGNLEKLKFNIPPIEDQKRIVKILDEADALRQKRKQAIKLLDDYLKSLFLEMFGKSDYSTLSLESLALEGRGTFSNGPFGSDLLCSEFVAKGVPVVYIRDIRNGSYEWKSNIYVTEEKAKSLTACQIKKGDLLITKVGDPPGISAIYPNDELAIMTQDVIRLRTSLDIVNNIYLQQWLNSHLGKHALEGIIIQGTRMRFPLKDFKKLKVPVPPINLQDKFAEVAGKVETIKKSMLTQSAELENQFQALMQKAFNGQI